MKRALLFAVCIFICAQIFSQTIVGNQQVITVNTGGNPSKSQSLLYLPDTYSTDTSHYPLIIFLGGLGEQGSDINLLLNYGTLPYRISQGFNPVAVNPVDGKTYKFIVFSPQGPAGSWGWQCVPHLRTMLPQIEAAYRVDPSRIYVTGLSAGGWGTWSCITDDTTFCKGIAAVAPISSAAAQNPQNIGNAAIYNVPVWTICGDQDAFWPLAQQYTATINALNPQVPMKLTDIVGAGHSAWLQGYDPTWYDPSDPQKLNLYSWFLQYSRTSTPPAKDSISNAPVAVAGNDLTVILPADSATLNGSKSYDSVAKIISYQWSAVSGPSTPLINYSDSVKAKISKLKIGTYKVQLAVTDSKNNKGFDTVTINVKNDLPIANAGPDVTLQLPVNSTVLNGSTSYDPDGSIQKYKWLKIGGPGEFAISNTDSAKATLSNLVKGIYLVKLTVTDNKNATASDTVQVTVLDSSSTICHGKRIYIHKWSDNGYYIDGSSFQYNPGDTLVLTASQNPYSYFSLEGIHGTANCPVTIINEGGQVSLVDGFALSDCSYVHIDGTGSSAKYGFRVEDPTMAGVAVDVFGRSANIEINNLYIHDKTYGFWVKQDGSCIDSLQYPNWIIDGITIHDNKIVRTNQEGMYLGSTDPNGTRPVSCDGVITYPKPLRLGDIKVYNNFIDSTNRSGIQLSCASTGRNHIYNNVISNCGFEFNPDQGNGISLGGYSHGYVHDNVITNTFALGILCLGAGHVRIENNTISNSGHLGGYVENGMANIMVDTRPTNPVDSSLLYVENNKLNNNTDYGVRFYTTYHTYRKGNIICNNTGTVNVAQGINWISCPDSSTGTPVTQVANTVVNNSSVYPNPAKDLLHVQLNADLGATVNLIVCDGQGRTLNSQSVSNSPQGSTQTVNIRSLMPGFYYLQIVGKKEKSVLRFIKE